MTAILECYAGDAPLRNLEAERLLVCRPGLGREARDALATKSRAPSIRGLRSTAAKTTRRLARRPASGAIMEDPRRKGLRWLYGRRNCHHLNTPDPLKAMGLAANVDDQVLTVRAAVNYLTKYIGKLGGGQSAVSKVSSCVEETISKMPDEQEMTVASLLSKLFIHAAVPQEISSLEAWHVLQDLPRVFVFAANRGTQCQGHPVL